jgi:hypothetical protein
MNLEPGPDEALVARTARGFARDLLAPRAAARDRHATFPAEEVAALGDLGLLGVTVPDVDGGAGFGALALAHAIRELAAADASVAVTVAVTNMVADVLARFATPATRARFVPDLCAGRLGPGAFALSEAGAGSDPSALRTRYVPAPEGFTLSGSKQWITSGDRAGVLVVFAREQPVGDGPTDRRVPVSAFAIAAGAPGLSAGRHERKMGQRGSSTVSLALDRVPASRAQLVGEEGRGMAVALAALDGGRINVGAMAVGVGGAALDAALAYARARHQFGRPIADFQAVQFALADAATSLDAAWLLVTSAAWHKDRGARVTRQAAQAKLFASEAALKVCDAALQIHGGYGYTREFPVERYLRDSRVTTIYEGTSQIQRIVIAREVLKELAHV